MRHTARFVGDALSEQRSTCRARPRMRLQPGSIGIAGGRTGIYTLPSPGGWQIVGRTPMTLFDAAAEQAFRLRAGMRVRFVAMSTEEFDAAWAE